MLVYVNRLLVYVNHMLVYVNRMLVYVNRLLVYVNCMSVYVNGMLVYVNRLLVYVNRMSVYVIIHTDIVCCVISDTMRYNTARECRIHCVKAYVGIDNKNKLLYSRVKTY